MFRYSKKLHSLPPYLFLELDQTKRKAKQKGQDIIDLGIGDPDQAPPDYVIRALKEVLTLPGIHRYSLDQGDLEFRQAISDWYLRRFKVKLDPDNEILPLIGSKEGLTHFPLAFLNPNDYAIIPDPAYPAYQGGVILAGSRPYRLPLKEANDFLPEFKRIPYSVLRRTKMIFINYPNNPTSSVASREFYQDLIGFAAKYKIIVVSDLAYSEITYDGYKSPSILEIEGAKEVAVEFHSLSKTYNMTGWRIGWACGNKDLIAALLRVKSNIDSGIFIAIQKAGIAALRGSDEHIVKMCSLYRERRDVLVEGLSNLGWIFKKPLATFYLWARIPKGSDSISFCQFLLEKTGVVVTPGIGFGRHGEGFVRWALTVDKERIKEAILRLKKVL
ncbi:MAG: LL-diaminopimelate aminotransferase [Candidatus Omnitrophica bacterium]|nr:LL-diaminopimelate aminotransferase [Candidatus Omnitrophota bacterium]